MPKVSSQHKDFLQKYQWTIIALIIGLSLIGYKYLDNQKEINPIVSPALLQIPILTLTSIPTPTLTPTPTPTIIQQTGVDTEALGRRLRAYLTEKGFADNYKSLSDKALGDLYYKKYGTSEIIPIELIPKPTISKTENNGFTCTTNTIFGTTYTNCYQ